MRKLLVILAFLALLSAPFTSFCIGPTIKLHTAAWDANTESDLAGYYLYWRTPTGTFSDVNRVAVAKATAPTFDLLTLNLPSGTYVIAVSAYDSSGNESALSNEVSWDAAYPSTPKNVLVK